MSNMLCVVCQQPADVWCHNDEAALCLACDESVHSVGPLAWKHKRTRLSSGAIHTHCNHEAGSQQPPASGDETQGGGRAMPTVPQALLSANDSASGRQSHLLCGDIPFMNDIEKSAAASFDINKLIEDFKAGDSFETNLLADRRTDVGSLDLLNLPMMPSFDVMTDALPDVRPQAPTAATSEAPPLQEPAKAAQADPPSHEQPDKKQHTPHALDGAAGGNSTSSASSLVTLRDRPQTPPDACHGAVPAVDAIPSPVPAAAAAPPSMSMPSAAAMHNALPILLAAYPTVDPCLTYIPATLLPKSDDARSAARQDRHARRERFRQKKALHTQKRATVRYISRKVYADTRPRINGRFIRKDSTSSL